MDIIKYLRQQRRRISSNSVEYDCLCKQILEFSYLYDRIASSTRSVNPPVVVAGTALYPRVAWLPPESYDEESGTVSYTPMPELPEFSEPSQRYYYLKQLADEALKKTTSAAQSPD